MHNLHTVLSRKLSAAETIIAAVEGQLVSKNKYCDKLQEQLALQAQQCEHLQELVADAHVEKQLLHESATRLQIECEEARDALVSKSEECHRLQEMAAKLRVGNQMLDVSASRLHKEREATRVDLELLRQENTQFLDTISHLEADAKTQASRIAILQRRLMNEKSKAKLGQEALGQIHKIKKHWRSMTKMIGVVGNGKGHEKGTVRDDPVVLDD